MGESEARRGAAWRFVRAIARSQSGGVTGAVVSGLLWQTGAVGAPLVVKYAIDHGIVTRDHRALLLWLLALLGVGLLEVGAGGFRHIFAIPNRSGGEARDRALDLARLDAVFNPLLETLPLIGIAAVLWLGGRRVVAGDLTLGSFIAFNAYVVMLVWPLRVLGQRVTTVQKALAASARITEVLEAEPRLVESRHPTELAANGDVRLEGVRFGHEGDQAVLDGLDLHLAPGESLALVGATGSGKSTVAGLLARLYDPDGGRILLDGHDLRDLRLSDVRRAVALVFEETFLFSESVRENIRFGRPDAGDAEVERATELSGATEFVSSLPEGYDTVLGERGFSLSGGQRQRIAIARAILIDAPVLILDEATSAVDA